MPVKRYSLKPSHGYDGGVTVIEDADGGMVTYEDYRELRGLLEEARKDAALWNGLALLHPMDIATVICGSPNTKSMMNGLAKRISARLKGGKE